MRQIVTGLFETYDDARRAQDALLLKGFAVTDIDLPVPGTDAPTGSGAGAGGPPHGVLAALERFVSSLFTSRPASERPPASPDEEARAASLRFALQRGAVLIGVRVFDDAHAITARDTLMQQQALQIDEHAPDWQPGAADSGTLREHSALDELGIGELSASLRQHAGRKPVNAVPAVPDDATLRNRYDDLRDTPVEPQPGGRAEVPAEVPADDLAVTALAPVNGGTREPAAAGGDFMPPLPQAGATDGPSSVPDEFLEYEEDFRGHHASRYQDDGAPFERYEGAYRYGAVLAQDVGNEGRPWSEIEPEARRGWETMVSGGLPHYPWEQVRDAVRHGWERAHAEGGGA